MGAPADGGMKAVIMQFLPIVAIFILFYFLLIRPQQKRMKQHRDMVAAVRRGDVVVTAGGMIGKIKSVHDAEDEVTVELAKGVEVRLVRSSISDVRSRTEPLRDAKSAEKTAE